MDFRILGPLEVCNETGAVALAGSKPRAVLALLLLRANEPVSAERLALELWGRDAPTRAVKRVHVHVSRLRKALRDPEVLATTPAGYRLRVRPGELDAERFERLVEDGQRALAAGQTELAAARLRDALALWRGPPLADLAFEPFAQGEIMRLEDRRLAALEARIDADLACGRHVALLAELQRLVAASPTRERFAGQLMLALYRCGRQVDALATFHDARHALAEQIGVEPGPELRRLQDAILRHDSALGLELAVAPPPLESDAAVGSPLTRRSVAAERVGRTRILERAGELAECADALQNAFAGRGSVVVIEGPAGIGKTELLRAVRDDAPRQGARVLCARGLQLERQLAFGGVRQLLEPIVRTASPDECDRMFSGAAKPARRLFTAELGEAGAAQDAAFAMLNAVYWVIASLADANPLILVLDDAHWLDPPTLRLLNFLMPRIEELRVLAMVATRPLDTAHGEGSLGRLLADPGSRVVRPNPLSANAVADLIRARTGDEPEPEFIKACSETTGGNPFYLTELLGEVARRQARPSAAEAVAVPALAPHSISLALRFRGAGSAESMAFTRALAILGDGARLEDVAEFAGIDEQAASGIADALMREALIAPGPGVAFAHPIVRSAVYAHLGARERARAHRRAARLLHDRGAPVELVAAHLMSTDPAADALAVERLRAAAAIAFARGAPDTAAEHLRRALAEPPEAAARAAVLLELGRAEASAAYAGAPAHFIAAYESAVDSRTRADIALAAAPCLVHAGQGRDALRMLESAAAELGGEDANRTLELDAQIVSVAMFDPRVAQANLFRLARSEDTLSADSAAGRRMLSLLGFQRMRSRHVREAVRLAERAVDGGRLLEESSSEALELASAVMTLICADRLETAGTLLDGALRLARERGSRYGFAYISFLRSEHAYRRGALRDVEADAEAALAISLPSRLAAIARSSTSMLTLALVERGALDEAAARLQAVASSEEQISPQTRNLFLRARGRFRLAGGDLAGGLEDLHACGRISEQLGTHNPVLMPWRLDAALAHQALGQHDQALLLADEELSAAHNWGTPGAIGTAQRLRGLLAPEDETVPLLREACAALSESPARLEEARALVDLGAALRRRTLHAEAHEPLKRGLELADRCGATVLSSLARAELAAAGTAPPPRPRTAVDLLSASERRVAQMAVRDLSDVDIAQTLFLTRKTVETHLANVCRKLSLTSRAELSAQMLELPDQV